MKTREFEITIDAGGTVELHVKGFPGRACLEAAKIFEQLVGELHSQTLTSEYYDPAEQVQYRVDQRQ
jgi:hypothetical protein